MEESKVPKEMHVGYEIIHHTLKPVVLLSAQYLARSLKKVYGLDKELPRLIDQDPLLKALNATFEWEIVNLKENDKKIRDFYCTVKDLLLVILARDGFYRKSAERMVKRLCESKCLSDVHEET